MFSGIVAGLGFLAWLAVSIFYILTLQKALNRCSPENRQMAPGMVWLLLIPIFNVIWNFFVVLKIAASLGAEFAKRGITSEPAPGKNIGLAFAILSVLSWVPFVGIAAFVCWIIYWVKINGFASQLTAPSQSVPTSSM
jgi:hypothetical protein